MSPAPLTRALRPVGHGGRACGHRIWKMTGHHHLWSTAQHWGEGPDAEEEFLYPLPADDNHRHFGGGQTEVDARPVRRATHAATGAGRNEPCAP